MNFYADYVRNKLNAAISSMSSQIEDYVKNPGHDFTRNRKMNFTSTINFLLTMEGGSLNSELHKYFNYDLNQITRSGFIKQRNKLKPDTMEYLFHKIGLTNLHSKNVEYICQEIYAKLILYNFCEIISSNIILEERNRKYTYQLNYTMAIQICRHYLRQTFVTIDVEGLIKKELSPQRPDRHYQRRVIKKRWVSFSYRVG